MDIKYVKYSEDAYCEHCCQLEPFTAVIEDGADYCIDCAKYSDDVELSKDDLKAIEIQETMYKFKYHQERASSLHKELIGLVEKADLDVLSKLEKV